MSPEYENICTKSAGSSKWPPMERFLNYQEDRMTLTEVIHQGPLLVFNQFTKGGGKKYKKKHFLAGLGSGKSLGCTAHGTFGAFKSLF